MTAFSDFVSINCNNQIVFYSISSLMTPNEISITSVLGGPQNLTTKGSIISSKNEGYKYLTLVTNQSQAIEINTRVTPFVSNLFPLTTG
jgi:hypothetical protein